MKEWLRCLSARIILGKKLHSEWRQWYYVSKPPEAVTDLYDPRPTPEAPADSSKHKLTRLLDACGGVLASYESGDHADSPCGKCSLCELQRAMDEVEAEVGDAPVAPLLTARDVAKKLANVAGIDRWAAILQEWLNSYTDRWKAEEKVWRDAPVSEAPPCPHRHPERNLTCGPECAAPSPAGEHVCSYDPAVGGMNCIICNKPATGRSTIVVTREALAACRAAARDEMLREVERKREELGVADYYAWLRSQLQGKKEE